MSTDAPEREAHYTRTAKWLHWLMAFFLILDLSAGQIFADLPEAEKADTLMSHSSLGLILLTLVLVRLMWRRLHMAPALPDYVPGWQVTAARLSHYSLYTMMIFVPVTGIYIALSSPIVVMPFGAWALGGAAIDDTAWQSVRLWHEAGTKVLIALVAIHLSAALHHRLVRRDGVFARMAPQFRRPRD